MESILSFSITVFFAGSNADTRHSLDHIVRLGEKLTGRRELCVNNLHNARAKKRERKRARKIIMDKSHPSHHLFKKLRSSWRFCAIKTKTTRHKVFSPGLYPFSMVNLDPQVPFLAPITTTPSQTFHLDYLKKTIQMSSFSYVQICKYKCM